MDTFEKAPGQDSLAAEGRLYLEDRNLLKLRRLDSSCPFFVSDTSIGT